MTTENLTLHEFVLRLLNEWLSQEDQILWSHRVQEGYPVPPFEQFQADRQALRNQLHNVPLVIRSDWDVDTGYGMQFDINLMLSCRLETIPGESGTDE